ncbi:MAG: DUF5660 family protein [Patescibacteria group bacterium]
MAQKYPPNKPKAKHPNANRDSFIESFRDIGQGSFDSFRDNLIKETPKDFVRQLLGLERAPISASGELKIGESLVIDQALEDEKQENKIVRAHVARARQLIQEAESYNSRQTQELKLQLKALVTEAEKVVKETAFLSQEIKIAVMQAPVEPGIYHITFFQNLLSFMRSFRKKIYEANLWLASANKRARKKTFWGQVQKGGAQRLLSSEDYSQRSAG